MCLLGLLTYMQNKQYLEVLGFPSVSLLKVFTQA